MTAPAIAAAHRVAPLSLTRLRRLVQGVYKAFIAFTHNGLALLGTALAFIVLLALARPDLRDMAEQRLLGWLLERQSTEVPVEPTAVDRATAANPKDLPKDQANVTYWLSRKYQVAPEPLSALVAETFSLGQRIRLDPTLILAVMAIESRFNPFAQSAVGAQGLMQVMTRVHTDKYEDFGGKLAAFDPVSNLRVGVQVLQDCIRRAGSVEGGLRLYVGAVSDDGSDYVTKVLAEHQRIQSAAAGRRVSITDGRPAAAAPQPLPLHGTEAS